MAIDTFPSLTRVERTTLQPVLRCRILLPVDAVLAAVLLLCLFVPDIPAPVQLIPFAASLVLFGLPHGALDHLVPARLAGRRPTIRSIGVVVALYGILGTAVVGIWFATPVAAFAGFILMTWFHWGQGDLYLLTGLESAKHLRPLPVRIGTVIVRGGLPMLVPLLAHPDAYRQVLIGAAGLIDPAAATNATAVFDPPFRLIAGILFAAITIATLLRGALACRTAEDRAIWRADVGETLFLAAFFTIVPAILAIGLYFCLWHAIRHIIRLALLEPTSKTALLTGDLWTPIRRFARDAWPITLIAIVVLIGFALLLPTSLTNSDNALGLYLILISALTLPHVFIVTWMDHTQHIWAHQP